METSASHMYCNLFVQVSSYRPLARLRATLPLCREPAAGKQRIGSVLGEPNPLVAMSKFNNKFSFYMLMFCGTGTIFNLALLNFGKWGV